MPFAVGPSELSLVLIVLCAVVVPVAAIAFARSGKGLEDLGKGTFSIDRETPPPPGATTPSASASEHEEEIRQMVEASAWRRRERGEGDTDVQAEIDRLLGLEPGMPPDVAEEDEAPQPPPADDGIRAEIRQLVVANNERRERRGEQPLDVETEVERRVRDWT